MEIYQVCLRVNCRGPSQCGSNWKNRHVGGQAVAEVAIVQAMQGAIVGTRRDPPVRQVVAERLRRRICLCGHRADGGGYGDVSPGISNTVEEPIGCLSSQPLPS